MLPLTRVNPDGNMTNMHSGTGGPMSEPMLTADEIHRYAVTGVGGHGVQGEPGTAPRSAHETPAALELYGVIRAIVADHRVPLDEVDALTADLFDAVTR